MAALGPRGMTRQVCGVNYLSQDLVTRGSTQRNPYCLCEPSIRHRQHVGGCIWRRENPDVLETGFAELFGEQLTLFATPPEQLTLFATPPEQIAPLVTVENTLDDVKRRML
jgi:hypothetical protein